MDLGLTARVVAARLGVSEYTVLQWEWGQTDPRARFVPAIVDFLEYAPLPPTRFSDWLRAARRARGLTQAELAARLGLDRTTVYRWEREGAGLGRLQPAKREALLRWVASGSGPVPPECE